MHGEYAGSAEAEPAEISGGALTVRKGPPISPFVARCEEHYDAEATGECRDCRRSTCEPCSVEVRRVGTLCTHCALVRAGIRR